MMRRSTLLVTAALMAGASPAAAQEASSETASIPTCTELGVSRVAMTVPPGRTKEELREALATSTDFPAGTQVVLLESHQIPQIADMERFGARIDALLRGFLRQEIRLDGLGATLLEIDEEGTVVSAHPATGNRGVDRQIVQFWRSVKFHPVVAGECRAKAWVHVRASFSTEDLYYEDATRMEVQITP